MAFYQMKKITAAQKTRHNTTTNQRMASFVFHEDRLVTAPSLSNEIRLNIDCEFPSPACIPDVCVSATRRRIMANGGYQSPCHRAPYRKNRARPESRFQRTPYRTSFEFSADRGFFPKVGRQTSAGPIEPLPPPSHPQCRLPPVVVQ